MAGFPLPIETLRARQSGMQPDVICSQTMGGCEYEQSCLLEKEWFFKCSAEERKRGAVMIREASIYALKKLPEEEQRSYGIRVLTMRRWPRGVGQKDIDLWMPSAGPSEELLAAVQACIISWDVFLAQYRQEQQHQFAYVVRSYGDGYTEKLTSTGRSIDYLRRLEQQQGVITVCCWERDVLCHRFTLVQLIEELAAQVCSEGGKDVCFQGCVPRSQAEATASAASTSTQVSLGRG